MDTPPKAKGKKDCLNLGVDPPIIVFVNGKSGGQEGARVKKKLTKLLPDGHVFDLSEGGPTPGLLAWEKSRATLRIVAAGGDGTVGWVLSALDKLGWDVWPAVAVLPLGTGNDMARILRWGKGYAGEDLLPYIKNVSGSNSVIPFDRWMVRCSELSEVEVEAFRTKQQQKAKTGGGTSCSSSSDDDAKKDQIIFEERQSRREAAAHMAHHDLTNATSPEPPEPKKATVVVPTPTTTPERGSFFSSSSTRGDLSKTSSFIAASRPRQTTSNPRSDDQKPVLSRESSRPPAEGSRLASSTEAIRGPRPSLFPHRDDSSLPPSSPESPKLGNLTPAEDPPKPAGAESPRPEMAHLSLDNLIAGLSSAFSDFSEPKELLDVDLNDDPRFSSTSSSSSSSSSSTDDEPGELPEPDQDRKPHFEQTSSSAIAVPSSHQPLQRGSSADGEPKAGWLRSESAKRTMNNPRDHATSPRAWSAGKLARESKVEGSPEPRSAKPEKKLELIQMKSSPSSPQSSSPTTADLLFCSPTPSERTSAVTAPGPLPAAPSMPVAPSIPATAASPAPAPSSSPFSEVNFKLDADTKETSPTPQQQSQSDHSMIVIPKSERSAPSIASNRASAGRPAPRGESLQRLSDIKSKQQQQIERSSQPQTSSSEDNIIIMPLPPSSTPVGGATLATTGSELAESKSRTSLFSSKKDNKKAKEPPPVKEKAKDIEWVMNNYFSVGIDSQVCLDFHNMRENHPGLFKSKYVNFGWYGMLSMKNAVGHWQHMKDILHLVVDGQQINVSSKYMAVVVLNIPSYAGGTDLWGTDKKDANQTVSDYKFEVVGIRGVTHMGLMQGKVSRGGHHICQGKEVHMTLLVPMAVQIDGEAWTWPASTISITHQNQSRLLLNKNKDKKDRFELRLTHGIGGDMHYENKADKKSQNKDSKDPNGDAS